MVTGRSRHTNKSGATRLFYELEPYLVADTPVWEVPVNDGGYSALVVTVHGAAVYLRHVAETSVEKALDMGFLVRDEKPSTVPRVVIPSRELVSFSGLVMEKGEMTEYLGHRLRKPVKKDSQDINYSLDLQALGKDLKKFRTSQGWTLSDTAMRLGMSARHWYRMEQGGSKYPSAQTVLRLMKVMGVQDYSKYLTRDTEDAQERDDAA